MGKSEKNDGKKGEKATRKSEKMMGKREKNDGKKGEKRRGKGRKSDEKK